MRNKAVDGLEEISLNAQALRTLNECVRERANKTPAKKEIYGSHYDFYEVDADEIENLIFTANKMLCEIEALCKAALEALAEGGKE